MDPATKHDLWQRTVGAYQKHGKIVSNFLIGRMKKLNAGCSRSTNSTVIQSSSVCLSKCDCYLCPVYGGALVVIHQGTRHVEHKRCHCVECDQATCIPSLGLEFRSVKAQQPTNLFRRPANTLCHLQSLSLPTCSSLSAAMAPLLVSGRYFAMTKRGNLQGYAKQRLMISFKESYRLCLPHLSCLLVSRVQSL